MHLPENKRANTSSDGAAWTEVDSGNSYSVVGGNFASGTTSFCGYGADGGVYQLHEEDGSWSSGVIPGLYGFVVTRLGDRLVAAGSALTSQTGPSPGWATGR